ncbi:MAG: hypothetical protein XXXJIFNMEKO3_03237 [Candidatus Erwinia impunctatus]|nr:hypothetical protein XXXJIFNMEKO_03237 [Culicoides impunctatus]
MNQSGCSTNSQVVWPKLVDHYSLQAVLALNSWTKASAPYAITAGAAVYANSGIVADHESYVAGGEMKVTVTLKDAQGNPVPEQSGALGGTNVVSVANAQVKATGWSEGTGNAVGTYTRTYTAITSGKQLTATLKLSGWSGVKSSGFYTISSNTTGPLTVSVVSLQTAVTSLPADSQSAFTYKATVKDQFGNLVNAETAGSLAKGIIINWKQNTQATGLTLFPVNNPGSTDAAVNDVKSATDENGEAWISLLSRQQISNVRVSAQVVAGSTAIVNADKLVNFTVNTDASKMRVKLVELTDSVQTKVANGTAYFSYRATVVDANGDAVPLAGVAVVWDKVLPAGVSEDDTRKLSFRDSGGVQTAESSTDAHGLAVIRLSSTLAVPGVVVTAAVKANGSVKTEANKTVTFTADSAVKDGTSIVTDGASYAAGSDIKVTVTLKDTQGNPVTGQSGALSGADVVTVSNAQVKDTAWAEGTGDNVGTYTRTYTAVTSGSSLKAKLALNSWTKESGEYAITAGAAVQLNSAIVTDVTSYVAGDDIKVTVTLVDTHNNRVPGQSSALLASGVVTVSNAQVKDTAWAEGTGDNVGTYTRTYTAVTSGSSLKAKLALNSWTKESGEYAITTNLSTLRVATVALQNNSVVSQVANGESYFTYHATLKDKYGNALSGSNIKVNWQVKGGQSVVLSSSAPSGGTATVASQTLTDETGKAVIYLTTDAAKTLVSNIVVQASSGERAVSNDAEAPNPWVDADKATAFTYGPLKNITVNMLQLNSESNIEPLVNGMISTVAGTNRNLQISADDGLGHKVPSVAFTMDDGENNSASFYPATITSDSVTAFAKVLVGDNKAKR